MGILDDVRRAHIFGDSITDMAETAGGVDVTFARSAPRTFHLVVGADGIHSNVRRLAFGPEADYVRHLGYHYAMADVGLVSEDTMYNEPGRAAGLGGPEADEAHRPLRHRHRARELPRRQPDLSPI
jgi:2-polyprenyl-6-methoxyphenol hydroxylase-like FAD-dependent oxidoreductase